MLAMMIWMLAIAVSLVLLIVTAAGRPGSVVMGYAHLAIAAASCVFFAAWAIKALKAAAAGKASRSTLAAHSARYIGAVWGWAALVTFLTYGLGIMPVWREWKAHALAMAAITVVCLGVAAILDKSDARAQEDETMLKLSRYLAIGQLVAMVLVMIGLTVDGHMSRFLIERFTDWPAKHVMFFGAMAIAVISAASLKRPG